VEARSSEDGSVQLNEAFSHRGSQFVCVGIACKFEVGLVRSLFEFLRMGVPWFSTKKIEKEKES